VIPAAKHFDPVIGVDVHLVQPPGPVPPIPVPHPFVGFLFDPFDYLPVIGATVFVNGLPRAIAGTVGRAGPFHVPIGGAFVIPPGNMGEMFMGSSSVTMDGEAASHGMLPVLTCQSFGMAPPLRSSPRKGTRLRTLVLPTSTVLPIPAGLPGLIGGPPTISMTALAMGDASIGAQRSIGKGLTRLARSGAARRAVSAGAGAARTTSRAVKRGADRILSARGVSRQARSRNRSPRGSCTLTGHPVDVATGKVLTDAVDFTLPGPFPLEWERVWYSTSDHRGPLGHGWHHALDLALLVDPEEGAVVARLADGRYASFTAPTPEVPSYNALEKLWLHRTPTGYILRGDGGIAYHFPSREGGLRFRRVEHPGAGPYEPQVLLVPAGGPVELPLLSIEDRNGHRIELNRSEGRLVGLRDSSGRHLEVDNDEVGRIVRVSVAHPEHPGDPARAVELVRYAYDDGGDLVEARDAGGRPFRYAYRDHLLVRETDRGGFSFHFAWEGRGTGARCVRTRGDGGLHERTLVYDREACTTLVTDSRGATTRFEWNELGLVVLEVDADGGERWTEWDEDGNRLSETDPLGATTGFGYVDGRLASITDPLGAETRLAYDAAGNLVARQDADGSVWVVERDSRGNIIASIGPDGAGTRYTLGADGLPLEVVDALGRVTRLEWDKAGNLTCITEADEGRTRLTHDFLGRLVRRTDAEGGETTLDRDDAGRVVAVTDSAGRTSRFRYDGAGNLDAAIDPAGRERTFRHGPLGVLQATTEPSGATTLYRHDREGELLAVHDAAGRLWRFRRDRLGRVIEERDVAGRLLRYGYDGAGRLVESTDARGSTTRLERDELGRLSARILPDGTAERYHYDPVGRLVRADNGAAAVEWEYDEAGRVVSETVNGRAVASAYDAAGNRIERTSPLGRALTFSYDDADRLREVRDPVGTLLSFDRDRLGRERQRVLPGGVVSAREYARTGEMLTQRTTTAGQSLLSRSYVYDPGGRLAEIHDLRGTTRFEHDPDGRLTAAAYPDGTLQRFLWDEAGNASAAPGPGLESGDVGVPQTSGDALRVPRGSQGGGKGGSGSSPTGGAGVRRERITPIRILERTREVDGWTLRFDADGSLLEKRKGNLTWSFAYDAAGRLTTVTQEGGATVRFDYDALGRRVRKEIEGADGWSEVIFLWDGDHLLGEIETDVAGEVTATREYLFDPDGFAPRAVWEGGGAHLIETDQVGTPIAAVDRGGTLSWSAEFSAFGEVTRTNGTLGVRIRFPGQYEDPETGLCYNRFRYYDPELRIYTQPDPIGLAGGVQTHGYVQDPTAWVDPYGLSKTCGGMGGNLTAGIANSPHVVAGRRPPYAPGSRARDVSLQRDRQFARVHGPNNQAGSWIMRPEEIRGLSPVQIKDRFALPDLPKP
jgi:RHS repeat-associated protein